MGEIPQPGYAARVAAEIDRLFIGAMAAGRESGGRELVARHGPGAGGSLVEFRTALAWPGRGVPSEGFAAVLRCRDLGKGRRAVAAQAAQGWLAVDADGTFRATARGHAFLRELYALHAEVTGWLWAGWGRCATTALTRPAAAWAAAGQTAAGIQAMPSGPAREAIEAETNARAAVPYAVLPPPDRRELLNTLSALGR